MIHISREAESDAVRPPESRGQSLCGLEEEGPALEPRPKRESALSAAAASPSADGRRLCGASSLTLWQLSGMQSGNTIWDIAFPT